MQTALLGTVGPMTPADPLDAAIDAVVHAVDRLERATRHPADRLLRDPAQAAVTPEGPASAEPPRKGKKGKKHRIESEAYAAAAVSDESQHEGARLESAPVATEVRASIADPGVSPELHELVGRLVARSQQLDDHLAAAQQLRGEIDELVRRLAVRATTR